MSNKQPKLSVFMITYNHEAYIKQAIDSILMQQINFSIEIVIGEDCSTDGTKKILEEYKKLYPDIFKLLLHKKNIGAISNQIITMQSCIGKYIAMLEGDDYWVDPYKLQKQVDFLENNPEYSICYHRVNILLNNEVEEPEQLNTSENPIAYTIEDLAKGNIIHTPSVIFRSNLINKFPDWFVKSPAGDYILHMLNAQKGKIYYMPEIMAVYRMHDHSSWSSQHQYYRFDKWMEVLKFLLQEEFNAEVKLNLQKQLDVTIESKLIAYLEEKKWDEFVSEYIKIGQQNHYIASQLILKYFPSYLENYENQIKHYNSLLERNITNIFINKIKNFFKN